MSAVIPPQPTTEQLVTAMLSGVLPFLGPYGIAASALVPAAQQVYDTFTTHPGTNFTVTDLATVVGQANVDLAQLRLDRAAQTP